MRFNVAVVNSFLGQLNDLDRLGLDGICLSQINLLRSAQAAYGKLRALGWTVKYDAEGEVLEFENPTVPENIELRSYLLKHLKEAEVDKLLDELLEEPVDGSSPANIPLSREGHQLRIHSDDSGPESL